MPSEKSQPFFPINNKKIVPKGKLIFDINIPIHEWDFTYCCTCGGHITTSTNEGKCNYTLTDNIIKCNPNGCAGVSIILDIRKGKLEDKQPYNIKYGGLLIQITKQHFYHNFKINENLPPSKKSGF